MIAGDFRPDPEDIPYELVAQAAYERKLSKWRCSQCGGSRGHHRQLCPEAIGETPVAQHED